MIDYTILGANPAQQMFAWFVELLFQVVQHWETASLAGAFVLAAYLTYLTLARVRGEADDPSVSVSNESAAGQTSILLSGVHLVLVVVGAIAFLTWPAPIESPAVGIALGGVVALHFVVEKRERGEL